MSSVSPSPVHSAPPVDAVIRRLLVKEPYFGHLLTGMVRVTVDGPCAIRLCVAGRTVGVEIGLLRWAALTDAARVASLKHELIHLSLKHPLRARAFADLEVWGLACDLVVNQLMDTHDLPDAVTLAAFAALGLREGASADAYYAALAPFASACRAGTCSGSAAEAFAAWCRACSNPSGAHGSWRAFAELQSGLCSVMETQAENLVRSTLDRLKHRGIGSLAGALREQIELVLAPPAFDWQRVLRLFHAASARTRVRNTIARPSKRYGTTPGIRIEPLQHLAVAVDTSGSMRVQDLEAVFAELHNLWRRGTQLTVIEADADVQRVYAYKGTIPGLEVRGRCGTSFDPAIAQANALDADGLVYFTDGYGAAPTVKPRVPVLWVVTEPDGDLSHLPGRHLRLPASGRT